MRKPSTKAAKIAVAALAIPLFGGFATYAAAQVSTKPAPQVVIPGGPGSDDKGGVTKTTVSDDAANHDANDDKGGVTKTTVSDDPANHDANDDNANDDKGGVTKTTVSDDPANHDANDDKGGVTKTTVSDDPANHDANDDNGHDSVTPATPATTPVTSPTSSPVTVDDHGGKRGGGGHGSDG